MQSAIKFLLGLIVGYVLTTTFMILEPNKRMLDDYVDITIGYDKDSGFTSGIMEMSADENYILFFKSKSHFEREWLKFKEQIIISGQSEPPQKVPNNVL